MVNYKILLRSQRLTIDVLKNRIPIHAGLTLNYREFLIAFIAKIKLPDFFIFVMPGRGNLFCLLK